MSNDFEWLEEIQASFTLEPNTMYYFPDRDGTFCELTEIINPAHDKVHKFLKETKHPGRFISYFVTDEDLDIRGWCNLTKWWSDGYPPNIKKINIRKILDGV